MATSKTVTHLVGAKVWCLVGTGRPRRYALGSWFVVDKTGTHRGKRFDNYISGKEGVNFEPMIPLNQYDWFLRFQKSQHNFRFGLQPIGNDFLPLFRSVAKRFEDDERSATDVDAGSIERRLQEVRIRRGQSAFRQKLLEAYGNRCAVTGCSIVGLLDGAHIVPVKAAGGFRTSNGLLLRTDIHTLFDLDLLRIRPVKRTIEIAAELVGTEYEHLAGARLREPGMERLRPRQKFLEVRWKFNRGISQ